MPKFRSEGLSLTVEDVERSVAFYVGKLGLELAYLAAPAFAMVRNGDGGLIGLLSLTETRQEGVVAASPQQHRGVHVEFTTDDLDGLHTELVAAGVDFAAPPHDEPGRAGPRVDRLAIGLIRWASAASAPPAAVRCPTRTWPGAARATCATRAASAVLTPWPRTGVDLDLLHPAAQRRRLSNCSPLRRHALLARRWLHGGSCHAVARYEFNQG